jgi:DNA-binding PadR family transcriptional regulator
MAEIQPMTEAMFYILLALLRPGHGYGMMLRISELSGQRLRMGPGTLYGVLTRMKKEKLIALESETGRRKTYAITERGRKALLDEYERLKMMVRDGLILEDPE